MSPGGRKVHEPLRKDLLKHLGVQPGEKIAVDKLPDGPDGRI
jgi:hypothetical protein